MPTVGLTRRRASANQQVNRRSTPLSHHVSKAKALLRIPEHARWAPAMVLHAACLAVSVTLVITELRPSGWHADGWLATCVALILVQYAVTAVQLWCSHSGTSLSIPALALFRAPTFQARGKAHTLLVKALLSAFPPLMDLAATCILLRSAIAQAAEKRTWLSVPASQRRRERQLLACAGGGSVGTRGLAAVGGGGVERSPALPLASWMALYARRRLGIAGVLQAAPQTFFHIYMLLYCYTPHNECLHHRKPHPMLLGWALALDVALLAVVAPAALDFLDMVSYWLTWGVWGALLREVVDSGLYIADIGFDINFVLTAWGSGVWWLKVLPLLFLVLQYPASAALLLAWNWPDPPDAQARGLGAQLAERLAAAWAWLVLSASLWLVDIAAVFILLSSSAMEVVGGLRTHSLLWWLLLPLEYLHWILPSLRALCLSGRLPAVAAILQHEHGAEDVWAENHMFARLPMEALLEALPQLLLQGVTYVFAPGNKVSLLSFMFSMATSLTSIWKVYTYVRDAGATVRLGFWQSLRLLLQLQGSFRVPAAALLHNQQERRESRTLSGALLPVRALLRSMSGTPQVTPSQRRGKLSVRVPPSLTPLQEAGFIEAQLADHSRQRVVANQMRDVWDLELKDLRQSQLVLRGVGHAELALTDVLREAAEKLRLQGLQALRLAGCFCAREHAGGLLVHRTLQEPFFEAFARRFEVSADGRPLAGDVVSSLLAIRCAAAGRQPLPGPAPSPSRQHHEPGATCADCDDDFAFFLDMADEPQAALAPVANSTDARPAVSAAFVCNCGCVPGCLFQAPFRRLVSLRLDCTAELRELPVQVSALRGLRALHLAIAPDSGAGDAATHGLTALPRSIGALTSLQSLRLRGCARLEALPVELGGLTSLTSLVVTGCHALRALPDSLSRLQLLRSLRVDGAHRIARMPEGLGGLAALEFLELQDCGALVRLPESVSALQRLHSMDVLTCRRLEALPEGLGAPGAVRALTELCVPLGLRHQQAVHDLEARGVVVLP